MCSSTSQSPCAWSRNAGEFSKPAIMTADQTVDTLHHHNAFGMQHYSASGYASRSAGGKQLGVMPKVMQHLSADSAFL